MEAVFEYTGPFNLLCEVTAGATLVDGDGQPKSLIAQTGKVLLPASCWTYKRVDETRVLPAQPMFVLRLNSIDCTTIWFELHYVSPSFLFTTITR